jgi:hypothetical protein
VATFGFPEDWMGK